VRGVDAIISNVALYPSAACFAGDLSCGEAGTRGEVR
jgi:hypothetical protein